jgi:hypothetical protein
MEIAILIIIAAAVLAFWAKWGHGVMALLESLTTPAEEQPIRMRLERRPQRDDELATAYIVALEARDRAA